MTFTIALLTLLIPLHASPGEGSQWNGTASFQSSPSSGTTVTLKFPTMISIPEASYPAKIARGTCADPAGIAYTLNPVQNSTSTSTIPVSIATLTAKPHHVAVMNAQGKTLTCGNIAEPRAAT